MTHHSAVLRFSLQHIIHLSHYFSSSCRLLPLLLENIKKAHFEQRGACDKNEIILLVQLFSLACLVLLQ
jgi:hypothetical protein